MFQIGSDWSASEMKRIYKEEWSEHVRMPWGLSLAYISILDLLIHYQEISDDAKIFKKHLRDMRMTLSLFCNLICTLVICLDL